MSRRRLTPEETALWQEVTRKTDPLHPERTGPPVTPPRPKPSPVAVEHGPPSIAPFEIGSRARTAGRAGETSPRTAPPAAPVQMDTKSFTRMKRGKLSPEARIDLHGMTLAQAHPALIRFITRAHGDGKRLVLVITGKGRPGSDDGPIPQQPGVLRRQVPQWLAGAALSRLVLQVAQAHISHGGGGAYYVYLRRNR